MQFETKKERENMNHKYRKRPVVIEAFQMTRAKRWDNNDWPAWLHEAWQKDRSDEGSLSVAPDSPSGLLDIHTLEGRHGVAWNDWIIQGVQGEIYPCKPDIFAETYEPVQEGGE